MRRPRTHADSIWPLLLSVALLWPGHGLGLLDGLPLDGRLEAVLVGVLVPALYWTDALFTRHRLARTGVLVLVLLKLADAGLLAQQGWCARFETAPLTADGSRFQHSWDARADWRLGQPQCSAIMSRPYVSFTRFPVWFLNLQNTRPPNVPVRLMIDGYVAPREAGTLRIDVEGASTFSGTIGDRPLEASAGGGVSTTIPAGVTHLRLDATYSGSRWALVPLWNGRDVFASIATSRIAPRRFDAALASWLPALISSLGITLVTAWLWSATVSLSPTWPIALWTVAASAACGWAGATDLERLGRLSVPLLAGAIALPVPRRLQNLRGAFLLVGCPWLTLSVAGSFSHIGRITLYSVGDDWLEFQRFAHRIFMQGYWLEGGQTTFWFQPLYRWIAGALHVVFGDSSVGEHFLDGAALLVGALFAFYVVKRVAGFRWGLTAAVGTLATIAVGPTWFIVGRGLSEIVSSGFAYLAAFWLLACRRGRLAPAMAAAACIVLAFFSRLNNLPFVLALAALALPLGTQAGGLWQPFVLVQRIKWTPVVVVVCAVSAALLMLALRTWHYTGVFSALYGTQREHLSTFQSTGAVATLRRMMESLLMVVTMQDPPRLDIRVVLMTGGIVIAALALAGAPILRVAPLPLCVLCVAGVAGSLVARGSSYLGRFSIHVIPAAAAVVVCVAAHLATRIAPAPRTAGRPVASPWRV